MVVVPAFAERDQRQPQIVAAVVAGLEPALAEPVRQRIDGDSGVEEDDGRYKEAPDQHLPAVGAEPGRGGFQPGAEQEQRDRQHHRHQDVVAIEPAQFRETGEIADAAPIGAETAAREKPADMAAPETVDDRRMHIVRGVGMTVMIAVMRRPPQRSALHAGRADQREGELHRARGAEALVREVAVIETGDREHPYRVQRCRDRDRDRRDAHPEHREAGDVHRQERQRAQPVDAVAIGDVGLGCSSVEPAHDCDADPLCGGRIRRWLRRIGWGGDRHVRLLGYRR